MSTNKEDVLTLFSDSLEKVIQAHDPTGVFRKLTFEEKAKRLILTKPEEKQSIETCGSIDDKFRERFSLFFQTIAFAIEQKSGKIVSSIVELDHEGIGRVVLYTGRLILIHKSIRGTKKFTFTELEQMNNIGIQYISEGLSWLEKFPEPARS